MEFKFFRKGKIFVRKVYVQNRALLDSTKGSKIRQLLLESISKEFISLGFIVTNTLFFTSIFSLYDTGLRVSVSIGISSINYLRVKVNTSISFYQFNDFLTYVLKEYCNRNGLISKKSFFVEYADYPFFIVEIDSKRFFLFVKSPFQCFYEIGNLPINTIKSRWKKGSLISSSI